MRESKNGYTFYLKNCTDPAGKLRHGQSCTLKREMQHNIHFEGNTFSLSFLSPNEEGRLAGAILRTPTETRYLCVLYKAFCAS